MGSFVKTVVGGALAILALYAVGKATYQLGKEVAQEEARLHERRDELQLLLTRVA